MSRHRDDRDRALSLGSPAIACRAARRRRSDLGFAVKHRQIVQRLSDIGMIGTERFLSDRQRSLVERLGVGVATLVIVKHRQIVQRRSDIGMIGTERFLSDRQRPLEERLGVGIATLRI